MKNKHYYLNCVCDSPRHMIRFVSYPSDEHMNMWISVQMSQYLSFFQRLKSGIKFIFKGKTDNCHWASCSIELKEVKNLKDFIEQTISLTENAEKKSVDEILVSLPKERKL